MRDVAAKCEYDREYNKKNYQRKLELNRQWRKKTGYKYDRTKALAATRKWQSANPDKVRQQRWVRQLRQYGLTPGQYDLMWASQNGKCAACGDGDSGKFHLDHNHDTGAVRGILCHNCNIALGMVRESTNRLEFLIEYLKKHS